MLHFILIVRDINIWFTDTLTRAQTRPQTIGLCSHKLDVLVDVIHWEYWISIQIYHYQYGISTFNIALSFSSDERQAWTCHILL